MNELDFLELAKTFANQPWIICLLIFFFTFVLEDVATVSAALLSSYGHVMPQAAFISLLAGIILGDLGLYGLGYSSSRFAWAKKILKRKHVVMANDWLNQREILAIMAARFIPGARLPTYTAMGFFKLPFNKFITTVFIASVIWTSILFSAIFVIGEAFVERLNEWHWLIAIIMIVIVVTLPKFIHSMVKIK